MMVAKLSQRCFGVVLQIPERLNVRVTQSDFLDLYGKSEEKQYELLRAVLDGTISFQDLKRRRVSFSGLIFIERLPDFRNINLLFNLLTCIACEAGGSTQHAERRKSD